MCSARACQRGQWQPSARRPPCGPRRHPDRPAAQHSLAAVGQAQALAVENRVASLRRERGSGSLEWPPRPRQPGSWHRRQPPPPPPPRLRQQQRAGLQQALQLLEQALGEQGGARPGGRRRRGLGPQSAEDVQRLGAGADAAGQLHLGAQAQGGGAEGQGGGQVQAGGERCGGQRSRWQRARAQRQSRRPPRGACLRQEIVHAHAAKDLRWRQVGCVRRRGRSGRQNG